MALIELIRTKDTPTRKENRFIHPIKKELSA